MPISVKEGIDGEGTPQGLSTHPAILAPVVATEPGKDQGTSSPDTPKASR